MFSGFFFFLRWTKITKKHIRILIENVFKDTLGRTGIFAISNIPVQEHNLSSFIKFYFMLLLQTSSFPSCGSYTLLIWLCLVCRKSAVIYIFILYLSGPLNISSNILCWFLGILSNLQVIFFLMFQLLFFIPCLIPLVRNTRQIAYVLIYSELTYLAPLPSRYCYGLWG